MSKLHVLFYDVAIFKMDSCMGGAESKELLVINRYLKVMFSNGYKIERLLVFWYLTGTNIGG